jgi:NAD kinase
MVRFKRIVVVTKRTQLQELIDRFVTRAQAKFYIEHMGLSFADYEQAHEIYNSALETLTTSLPGSPRHQIIDRAFLPTFTFDDSDIIVTLGNNGLVVNAAKYSEGRPILGINADPAREEGIVAKFEIDEVKGQLNAVLGGEFRVSQVTMAEARMNNGQRLLGFNDLFIGHRSHVSARYKIEFNHQSENHSSSGIIVSTGAGSTGWMRSVVGGSLSIARLAYPKATAPPKGVDSRFDWSADKLVFMVREPWPSRSSQTGIVFGTIVRDKPLRLTSHMPEGGVIFSDGVEQDAVPFTSGAIAEVNIAGTKANLIAR